METVQPRSCQLSGWSDVVRQDYAWLRIGIVNFVVVIVVIVVVIVAILGRTLPISISVFFVLRVLKFDVVVLGFGIPIGDRSKDLLFPSGDAHLFFHSLLRTFSSLYSPFWNCPRRRCAL